MQSLLNPRLLFDLDQVFLKEQFAVDDVFQLLGSALTARIEALLRQYEVGDRPCVKGKVSPHAVLEGAVYVGEGAEVGPFAYIQGPTFIAPGAEVRHGAFIRGSAYIGPKAVVGHTTEVKGSIFFDEAKAGHFAYVGDSILGRDVNLGAGTKLANLKLKGDAVRVVHPESMEHIPSGLRKLGALLGDHAQTGCNAVLSPGTILLANTGVLPCVHYHGTLTKGFARGG
ncbi:MAG: glucose-1-phosphate thymidylyltransferase [Oligoflexus sp.]|jgi:NDP-sugar pyrophosphorylase family protein